MAGQLTIDTLKASTGVLATQNGMTGIAKAWVNFNGNGSIAIRGSFNVSSVVRISAGYYTVNYTVSMPNTNYCVQATCSTQPPYNNDGAGFACICHASGAPAIYTGSVNVMTTLVANGAGYDAPANITCVAVFS